MIVLHKTLLCFGLLFCKHIKFEQGFDITLVNGKKGEILNEKS